MTHDELLAKIEIEKDYLRTHLFEGDFASDFHVIAALRAVVELCKDKDETAFHGDKAIFNSGRNSMRDEIIQAIEKELG